MCFFGEGKGLHFIFSLPGTAPGFRMSNFTCSPAVCISHSDRTVWTSVSLFRVKPTDTMGIWKSKAEMLGISLSMGHKKINQRRNISCGMGDYQSEPITFNCWRNGEIGYICWKDDTKFRKRETEEEGERDRNFMVKCSFAEVNK